MNMFKIRHLYSTWNNTPLREDIRYWQIRYWWFEICQKYDGYVNIKKGKVQIFSKGSAPFSKNQIISRSYFYSKS